MATDTTSLDDISVVRSGFEAFANGDLGAFRSMFHDDATWNHRNDDRFGGVHRGSDAIVAFIGESAALTDGTLRAEPRSIMANGEGHVAVLVRITGTRPDGRMFDDTQMLLFAVDDSRVRSVDQFIGDPPAVTAFWA